MKKFYFDMTTEKMLSSTEKEAESIDGVGNTNTNEVGVSDMNNKPSLVLASTAGSVEVTGSTIVGESDSIQLTAKNSATSGIELKSVEQSITLRVGQTTNSDTDDVGGGNIELVSGGASTTGISIVTSDHSADGFETLEGLGADYIEDFRAAP